MDKLILLTDYKGRFGSKHDDRPYRSGMDLQLLKGAFLDSGFEIEFVPFSNVNPADSFWKGSVVLYTSSEDPGLIYKQYIEDVVLSLAQTGANVIPRFEFLRANNNKVFMELLRDMLHDHLKGNIHSHHFGTLEELEVKGGELEYPVIVKGFNGAMGGNVFLAHDQNELISIVKRKVTFKSSFRLRAREYIRQIKHKGYKRDSYYRGRFVVQRFIPDLKNDWKVYFFGANAFVFYRPVFPEREFRASGGGYDNYRYGTDAGAPDGLLDFGWEIFRELKVPNVSMDIAWDGSNFYLLEFQCVYFGTAGILKKYSAECFVKDNTGWKTADNKGIIENVYAESVRWFLNRG